MTMPDNALETLYAEEMRRALSWRGAMDWTRNLSVLIVAGMAFVAFGLNGSSHLVLFLGSLSIFAFLIFESRMHQFAETSEQRLTRRHGDKACRFLPSLSSRLKSTSTS